MTVTTVPHDQRATVREPLSAARAHLITNTESSFEFLRWLSTRTDVAIDTETTGLDHDTDSPRLVQIGDALTGWAIPVERNAMVLDDAVSRFQGNWIMHNAPFDLAMLANMGIEIPTWRVKDTRIMAHVWRSTGSLELKKLSTELVDPAAAAAQAALDGVLRRGARGKGTWTWATIPTSFRPYWGYGCLDPILTYRICEIIEPQVMMTAPSSYHLEMAVQWIVERMARHGVYVDRPYTQQMVTEMRGYTTEIAAWCRTVYGISPGSDAAVAEVLVREGKIDPASYRTKRTPGGKISVDKEVLSGIDHPLATAVIKYRQSDKLAGTYLESYLRLSERDGRIHPSINSIGGMGKNPFEPGGSSGVRTGRMSCSTPNLQNVPIHTKEAQLIRNCFPAQCAEYCGCGTPHRWLSCDFEQIELRALAHLSEDPGLISAFRDAAASGVDMFTRSAREIFQDLTLPKSDERRQHVKNGFYATSYGAGPEKFAKTAGIRDRQGDLDVQSATAFLNRLHFTYPGIRALQRRIEGYARDRQRAEGQAYIRSPLTGRKFVADRGREYALLNYCVAPDTRVLCADLTWQAISKIEPGDEIVGFDEHSLPGARNGQLMRTGVAEKISVVRKPSVRVITDKGTVVCSTDHLWLLTGKHLWVGGVRTRNSPRAWQRADALVPGQAIVYFGEPWEVDTSRDAGWLAGMLDGEGCLTQHKTTPSAQLIFSQLPGPVFDQFVTLMTDRGMPPNIYDPGPNSTTQTRSAALGNRVHILRTLGMLRPVRWRDRWPSLWEGKTIAGNNRWGVATIQAIEPVGKRELISLQTSTRTFIAEGLFSHNCIQGLAGELLKMKIVEADRAGLGDFMVLPVHDEIDLDVPISMVDDVTATLKTIMNDEKIMRVPVTSTLAIADRWGDCEK